MRRTTIASVAAIALSTAALAQVGSAPAEQKLSGNDAAMPDDTTRAQGNVVANDNGPEPGAPSTALVNSAHAPVGQRPPK